MNTYFSYKFFLKCFLIVVFLYRKEVLKLKKIPVRISALKLI